MTDQSFNYSNNVSPLQARNQAVFAYLRGCGFSVSRIRKALVALNGVKHEAIAQGLVSRTSVSTTINGKRKFNPFVAKVLSEILGVPLRQLFPEE